MRVMIICREPFGCITDTLKLCEYIRHKHEVSFLGFDSLGSKQEGTGPLVTVQGVQVDSVSANGSPLLRSIRFVRRCIGEAGKEYDLVYIYYFLGCSLIRLLNPAKTVVVDFRTCSVTQSRVGRLIRNALMRVEASCFQWVIVISEHLREKFALFSPGAHIVPLGADRFEFPNTLRESLHLLYIGTLSGRKIEETIDAFSRFYKDFGDKLSLRYTVIGDGQPGQRPALLEMAKKLGVLAVMEIPGYIPHDQLKEYFGRCNVGVSYVPITAYYDHQPPTKTFEYLLAGMPVIATDTRANRRIISDINGVLVRDTPDAFYAGLCKLAQRRCSYDAAAIRESVADRTWENIMVNNAIPHLENIQQQMAAIRKLNAKGGKRLES